MTSWEVQGEEGKKRGIVEKGLLWWPGEEGIVERVRGTGRGWGIRGLREL